MIDKLLQFIADMSKEHLLYLVGVMLLFSACSPGRNLSSERIFSWNYDDLRLLEMDEVNSCGSGGKQDANDLIAVYSRMNNSNLEIRLDFLELDFETDHDLYLALDLVPGGSAELPFNSKTDLLWDVLIVDPADRLPFAIKPGKQSDGYEGRLKLIPRVFRDPYRDILVVSVNAALLPEMTGGYRVQAFLASEKDVGGEIILLDEIGPVRSDALPPAQAPLLLTFWNSFPAHTPAQSLRRWSGAHSGPLGGRHGLKYLLNAAGRYQIPIILLDLKNSASLSALENMGKLEIIQEKSTSGLLILPHTLPDPFLEEVPSWAAAEMLKINQEVSLDFNLQASLILYAPWLPDPVVFPEKAIFLKQDAPPERNIVPVDVYRWQDRIVIPLLITEDSEPVDIQSQQPFLGGLSKEIRCAALQTALAQERGDLQSILLLGGDLPRSVWGDPNVAESVLAYIAAHPWMKPFNAMDIVSLRPSRSWREAGLESLQKVIENNPSVESADQEIRILERLNKAPDGTIRDLAWQAYLALLAPAAYSSPQLLELRAKYLGQIGSLLAAARWEEKPGFISDCSIDTDLDGRPECVLATPSIFALFEADGARMQIAFVQTPRGVHQFIAPSSQFAIGLSDYSTWDLSQGVLADPEVIPGAFAGPWEPYQIELHENELIFESDSVRKIFTLLDSEIAVNILTDKPYEYMIPLAVSPHIRFQPGWGSEYVNLSSDQRLVWGIKSGPRVLINSSEEISSQMFTSSSALLGYPEDPNRDYSPGHFLPYPLAIATIMGDKEIEVVIDIIP